MQNKLSPGELHDINGQLNEAGYSTELIKNYSRDRIKAPFFKIKEWDYYLISDGITATALTIADNSYMSLISASFLDFRKPQYKTTSVMKFLTFGKLFLPSSSENGDVVFQNSRVYMNFKNNNGRRTLECEFKDFNKNGETFSATLDIERKKQDSMVIALPFKDVPTAFYYNQKINCMRAGGIIKLGANKYFYDQGETLATLDWGRGVWTYENTWYWASLSTYLNGKTFGLNLGYGFGDNSAATENMIFYDGVAHKIENVTFHIPTKQVSAKQTVVDNYMGPWIFTSSDGRLGLEFHPIIDRCDNTNLLLLSSSQHQVFGYFKGFAFLDDGTKLEFQDKLGFAEKVHNKW